MTTNQDSPNTAGAAEPVAWMYENNLAGTHFFRQRCPAYQSNAWTETPLYTHPPESTSQTRAGSDTPDRLARRMGAEFITHPSADEPRCRQFGTRERCFDCTHDDGCPSATPEAYAVMNPKSGGVSAPSTGQLYNASASAVPDDLVEAMGEALFALSDRLRTSGFLISDFNHASYERVVKALGALTAAIPAIRAQAVAEERAKIVAWLRAEPNIPFKHGPALTHRVHEKDIADAIEQDANRS